MKVSPPMRRLRFTIDVCFTSRGELVAGELTMRDSLVARRTLLGGWHGSEEPRHLEDILRTVEIMVNKAKA